jgi:predicted transcriptional regulator
VIDMGGLPPGPNAKRVEKIRNVLLQEPRGLWLNEIARRADMPLSTVHKYLTDPRFMGKMVKSESRFRFNKREIIRVFKLRSVKKDG